MPIENGITYRTVADLLSGGTTLEFNASAPERLIVRISTAEDALRYIPDFSFRVPEDNAVFLYPAYRAKFLQIIQGRQTRRDPTLPPYVINYAFTVNTVTELINLISSKPIDDFEKIKAYVAFSQQNIFNNKDVPISFRLIHSATGLTMERIQKLIQEDASSIFSIHNEQFISPNQELDI